ncbi:sterol desaturase family protein [Ruegeria sp. R14_0]|uniref:sterol desaturase family protein n=1 Tax=Ruegeria sp. R14_0 TaxID=2821100 RepID=UPI001ADB838E|nr:sterol desaturase family protein [Ruegeria sp. R14_0]MBO9445540.1 sterol desaturase family protein [Ruegeria sp. R14_0]
MDFLNRHISDFHLSYWETMIDDWFFVFALAFLAFELIRYAVVKKLNWTMVGDTVTNFITLAFFIGITFILLAGFYIGAYVWASQYAVFDIPTTWASFIIVLVLADLAYYWEHRILHRINFLWATHSVHHSSPFFNISVAYRHGPLDGLWPLFFHLPLVLLGFNPFMVLVAELLVQLYQTALHTEVVKKLWRPIEYVFNTPSHHRVHHGSNPKYLDKNYAGILIIWDRMFGTFEEEKEEVVYGLVKPIDSVNPFVAFLHGFARLFKDVWNMPGLGNKLGVFFGPPGWQPESARKQRKPAD